MSGKLGWIAFGGLTIGVVCLGVAAAVGGKGIIGHLDDFDIGDWDQPRCGVTMAGHDDTRSIDWNDSDEVQLEIPATVRYKRGEGDKLVIAGDAALLPLVRLDRKGHIRFDCRMRHPGDITVTLPGREFRSFSVKGSGDVTLEGIDQAHLEIDVAGHSNLIASGKADSLEYNLAGAGDAKLGGLDVARAELNVAGHGDTEVNVRDSLEVNIAGHGNVKLVTEPHHIETNIFGAGEIVHPNGDVNSAHGVSSRSHNNDDAPPPEPPQPPQAPVPQKPVPEKKV